VWSSTEMICGKVPSAPLVCEVSMPVTVAPI
jgi:hypothetical protein